MLNRIIQFALTQRLLVLVLTLGLVAAGIQSFIALPIDAFPDISPTQVKVILKTPGLTPEEVENQVTRPIEVELLGIPNQQILRSIAKYGLTDVTLDFEDGTDIYWARQQVAERLASVWDSLPADIGGGIAPMSTPLGELYMFTLDGPQSLEEKRHILDWQIRPVLRTVPGVADVNPLGGRVETFQVSPDPVLMEAHGFSYQELEDALMANNSNDGAGRLAAGEEIILVKSSGKIETLDQLRRLVVGSKGSESIYLEDIAEVSLNSLTRYGAVTDSGTQEAVEALVVALRGANARQVIAGIDEALEKLRPSLPDDLSIGVFYDRSHLVNRAVSTVSEALIIAVVLVILLLLFFLGDLRSAFTVALSLPLAALITFLLMSFFDMSANLMTLGGLAIAIGMLVDASVVVVENCVARLSQSSNQLPKLHILFRAVKEVAGPVVSGTVIILLVFAPLVTLQGLEGKLFVPVALTIMFALSGSLVISLTIIPVVSSWLIKSGADSTPRLVVWMQNGYRRMLTWTLAKGWPILITTAALFALAIFAYMQVGKSFMPEMDEGDLILQLEKIPTISLETSADIDLLVEQALLAEIPEIKRIVARLGSDELGMDPMGLNETDMFLELAPRDTWQLKSKDELKEKIRTVMHGFPGVSFGFTQPIDMRVSEMISGASGDLAVKVFGPDLDILQGLAEQIDALLKEVPGSADVLLQQADGMSYLSLKPNQTEMGRRGLQVADVQRQLRASLEGITIGEIQQTLIRSPLVIRYPKPADWSSLLSSQTLKDINGETVSLSELVTAQQVEGPVIIQRESGQRFALVDAYVEGRALVDYVEDARATIESNIDLPQGYFIEWGGEFENQQRASMRLAIMIPIAISLVFLVLFSTFRRIDEALLVLGNIPLALIGGIVALWISGIYLSVPASVGFIALLGVAVMNGVVLVVQFKQLSSLGFSKAEVIVTGAVKRLRPVLMTATTGAFGLIPLLFATGPGSEIQKPLAVVVTGGLVSSTFLTLFLLPLLYQKLIMRKS